MTKSVMPKSFRDLYNKGGRYYNKNITCIKVTFQIRDKLKELGFKGESYNDILERLLK